MGVTGLLPQLGPLIRHGNIYAAASGRRVGVDGHVWLHQLAYAHAQSIVLDRDYKPLAADFLQRAQEALGHGIDLVFVFDGAPTPAKRETDTGRAVRRAKAIAALQYNITEPDQKLLRAAVGLGWPAVTAVIRQLRKAGIAYIVAPHEGDAQLAYLQQLGLVWGVTTVDSDFIVHGMTNVFFNVNWRTGKCRRWERKSAEDPSSWPESREPITPFLSLLRGAGLGLVTCFALVNGCDYGTKVHGVGTKTSIHLLQMVAEEHGVLSLRGPDTAVPLLAAALKTVATGKNLVLDCSNLPGLLTDHVSDACRFIQPGHMDNNCFGGSRHVQV